MSWCIKFVVRLCKDVFCSISVIGGFMLKFVCVLLCICIVIREFSFSLVRGLFKGMVGLIVDWLV